MDYRLILKIKALLLESKRSHSDVCDGSGRCIHQRCICGASAWNLRVDRALSLNQRNISCPDCCNGTICSHDTGDMKTSVFEKCTTCEGDSRQ